MFDEKCQKYKSPFSQMDTICYAGFEVLIVVTMKRTVFWAVTLVWKQADMLNIPPPSPGLRASQATNQKEAASR
jgi:hypothetical protein